MNPYIEIVQLLLPAKFNTVISITKSAYEIIQTASNKFQPEIKSIMSATNYQTENPAHYSQLFLGSLTQETVKRKSISTKIKCLNEITNFLKKYSFTYQLNMIQICKEFYSQQHGCCIIDLKVLVQDLQKYCLNNKNILTQELLNYSIDELSLLFIEYVKGQYSSENIEDEFCQNFEDIQNDIYKFIILAVKKEDKNLYKALVNQIKKFQKNEFNNQNLIQTCTLIKETKIPYYQIKQLIINFFKQNQKYLQDELSNFYQFQLSNVIITRYAKKILDHQEFEIKSSLQIFLKQTHQVEEMNLKCQNILLQYFQQKEFLGIQNNIITIKLFYVLLQCNDDSDEFIGILKLITQITNLSLNEESQIVFTLQGDQRQHKIKEQFQKEIQEANTFWKQNVEEIDNLKVIFDLFLILSGTHFIQQKFQFKSFKPKNFHLLQKLSQYLNNGKYHYFNNKVIQCLLINMGNIYQQLLDIDKKDELKLVIQENIIKDIQYLGDRDGLIQFQNGNNFNLLLLQQNQVEIEKYLSKLMINLSEEYLKKKEKPNNLSLRLCSKKQNFTNTITLFIPGSSESKIENQMIEILNQNFTTVAVVWDFEKENTSWAEKVKDALKLLKDPLEAVANGLKAYTNSSFEKGCKEAKIVGQYLAYLIIEKKIFGDCQINIVAYSMGSLIMYEMMKVFDKLSNNQMINDIMILGGIVDIRKLQKRRWNCVFGNIYNVYSKKDMFLKLIGMSFKIVDNMCGINEVNQGYRMINNLNMSNKIHGHNDYGQQIQEILVQCDFQLYFRFIYE